MRRVVRKDAVKELAGGWFGATGHGDTPRRLFRTREEALACDGLLLAVNDPPLEKKKSR